MDEKGSEQGVSDQEQRALDRPMGVIIIGGVLVVVGVVLLGFTLHSQLLGGAVVALGAGLVYQGSGDIRIVIRLVAIGVLAWLFGVWNFTVDTPTQRYDAVYAKGGQYTARSPDLFGLITVRGVVRQPLSGDPVFVHAEADVSALLGVDMETIEREFQRALVGQRVPPDYDPRSDPDTARLVHGALDLILSGSLIRENPSVPEGAWYPKGTRDGYWGLFPDEYGHSCNFGAMADGTYRGKSSNTVLPARVEIVVSAGKLKSVRVLEHTRNTHNERAVTSIPEKMVEEGRADVDVVSGATRTSYILRSAVHNACYGAGGVPLPPENQVGR